MTRSLPLTIRTHYSTDDPECYGDYHSIDLVDSVSGRVIQSYGDYYHDKGSEKVEGFLDGLRFLGVSVKVTREDVADSNL